MSDWHVRLAARTLAAGGVIAYPTEGVYGLGCDPQNAEAVFRILAIKDRPVEKGLVVIACERAQLDGYVSPDADMEARIAATWPGPATWLLPAGPMAPPWITGGGRLLAARVSAHPLAAALCRRFGAPIVSTSANPGGERPARSALAVRKRLGGRGIDYLLPGRVGQARGPTPIRDARTGAVLRPG